MRIKVDRDRCVGAGMCVLTAPTVFDQGEDDGLVVLLDAEPGDEVRAVVEEAEQVCPSGAIAVRRD